MARIRIPAAQVMRVASADQHDALSPAEPLLPESERHRVELRPVGVPRLDGVESEDALVLPWRAEGLGMANAHERAGAHGRADRPLDDLRVGLAELPPAIGPPRVPMPAICGDLDARHDDG